MAEKRVQRRLAAILAADVVGYSRLMGVDEAGTLARLNSCREEIIDPSLARYGGRTVKIMGDGVLVEFASAVDAVQSALDVQSAMAKRNDGVPDPDRMAFRVGINVGDVIVEGDDIHGDGVNIAARLEGLSEPGGICISDDVFRQVRGKIDAEFDDLGPRQVKNLAEPVHAYAVRPARASATVKALPLPDKPSIAVLAFQNMSGDPEQEYFADGIAEDIITALSRSHLFFVIARNSSFSYKGTSPDIRQVAGELGVQYVLEGSVRKGGDRVRITAQLIDAATGNHVWAERYDRDMHDIFAVQDEITEAIAGEVAPSFVAAEAKRAGRKSPENLDAWDLAMRGNWHMWRTSKEDFSDAIKLFEEAVDLDPDSCIVQSGLALSYALEAGAGWADDPSTSRERANHAARRAVALDDQDAGAHVALALAHHIWMDNESAFVACRKALEINPNLAFAEGLLGLVQAHRGNRDEALRHVGNSQRLSPRDTSLRFLKLAPVIAALGSERYDEYLENAKRLTEATPDFIGAWRHLVAAYASLDRLEEAKAALEQVYRLSPQDGLELIRRTTPIALPEIMERYLDALRKAGLSE